MYQHFLFIIVVILVTSVFGEVLDECETCHADVNPPCRIVCFEKSLPNDMFKAILEASPSYEWGSQKYNFEKVKTVLIESGRHRSLNGMDIEFKLFGEEDWPVVIKTYGKGWTYLKEFTITFNDAYADYVYFGDVSIEPWYLQEEYYYIFGFADCSFIFQKSGTKDQPGFSDIRFHFLDLTTNVAIQFTSTNGAYILDPQITFSQVWFEDFTLDIQNVKVAPGHSSRIEFNDCIFAYMNIDITIENIHGVVVSIARSYFYEFVNLFIKDGFDTVVRFESNVVTYNTVEPSSIRIINIELFTLEFVNNFIWRSQNDLIEIDGGSALSFVIANNIIGEVSKFIKWGNYGYLGRSCQETCVFSHNYFFTDQASIFDDNYFPDDMTALYNQSLVDGNSAVLGFILRDNIWFEYDVRESCIDYHLKNEKIVDSNGTEYDITGLDIFTPTRDYHSIVRRNTDCPYRRGPTVFQCPCSAENWNGNDCGEKAESFNRRARNVINRMHLGDQYDSLIDWKILDDDDDDPDAVKREISVFDTPQEFTVMDSCINEYWGILIDSDYEIWMWGENFMNDYLETELPEDQTYTKRPIRVDRAKDIYTLMPDGEKWSPDCCSPIRAGSRKWVHNFRGNEYDSIPVKVVCTRTSVFVKTSNGDLYVLGRNRHSEIDGGQPLTSFHKTKENVYDIVASYHTVYLVLNERINVLINFYGPDEYAVMLHMQSIGANYFGALCANYDNTFSGGKYVTLHYNFVYPGVGDPVETWNEYEETGVNPLPVLTEWNYELMFDAGPVGDDRTIDLRRLLYPRIHAFQYGLYVQYNYEEYMEKEIGTPEKRRYVGPFQKDWFRASLFCGLEHPTLGESVSELKIAIFDISENSMLTDYQGIDFVDRVIDETNSLSGGCLYIVSGGDIYVSGSEHCSSSVGIKTNPLYHTPQKITNVFGDYPTDTELIHGFRCGYTCYMMTLENIYVFGRSNDGIALGVNCGSQISKFNCGRLIRTESSEFSDIVPGIGVSVPTFVYNHSLPDNMRYLNEKYDVLVYPSSYDTVEISKRRNDDVSTTPVMMFDESGMVDNTLVLAITESHVESMSETDIYFVEYDHFHNEWKTKQTVDQRCNFPIANSVGKSKWMFWSSVNEDRLRINTYYLAMDWQTHREMCDWDYSSKNEEFDVYYTRIAMVQNLFSANFLGSPVFRTVQHFFDLQVRFPKLVLKSKIDVKQQVFREYWSAYIVDKSFDRGTREGVITYITIARKPNIFVFPDIAIQYPQHGHVVVGDIETTDRVGVLSPYEPKYFTNFEVFELEKSETTPYSRDVICDERSCYQKFEVRFSVISDWRVCSVPMTEVPINYIQYCHLDFMDTAYDSLASGVNNSVNCVDPSEQFQFVIELSIDNLCGGELIENIDTDFSLELFEDFGYLLTVDTETTLFEVNDWLYFRATLISEKVTIENLAIERVDVSDESTSVPLIIDSTTTASGDDCLFVLDDLGLPNVQGFHFSLNNRALQLQPGERKVFTVEVYVSVAYTGNEVRVVSGRRNDMSGNVANLGIATAKQTLEIQIENTNYVIPRVWPYILVVCCLMGITLAVGVLFSCVIFIVRERYRRLKMKKRAKQQDVVEEKN